LIFIAGTWSPIRHYVAVRYWRSASTGGILPGCVSLSVP